MTMLEVDSLEAGYGEIQVLWDVSLRVEEDESIIAIIGPNGAGKSTLLKVLAGLIEPQGGDITLFGEPTRGLHAWDLVEQGFVLVPEEKELFGDMTVYENLKMGAYRSRDDLQNRLEEVYEMFPVLEERREQKTGTLSGGEQQMCAIARGLMSGPRLLALDEPSGGLAPQLTQRVFDRIEVISQNVPVILVEQHVKEALSLADRGYLLENGRIAEEGAGEELLDSPAVVEAYLS